MARLNILTMSLRGMIWLYRHSLSYFLGGQCRFTPTCSAYADKALELHGPFKGSWLAVRRICRCNPWGGQGYDPVPGNKGSGGRDQGPENPEKSGKN